MKQKLNRVLAALCTCSLGWLGFFELNTSSFLFFGEPEFPEE